MAVRCPGRSKASRPEARACEVRSICLAWRGGAGGGSLTSSLTRHWPPTEDPPMAPADGQGQASLDWQGAGP